MRIDHTDEVERATKEISVTILDGCLFYAPKEGSILPVTLCAFCKYSEFVGNNRNGFCKYRIEKKQEETI